MRRRFAREDNSGGDDEGDDGLGVDGEVVRKGEKKEETRQGKREEGNEDGRGEGKKEWGRVRKQQAKEHARRDAWPLLVECVRAVLLLVIFFVLFLPLQYYVLDPLRGVSHDQHEHAKQKVMDVICPQGMWV